MNKHMAFNSLSNSSFASSSTIVKFHQGLNPDDTSIKIIVDTSNDTPEYVAARFAKDDTAWTFSKTLSQIRIYVKSIYRDERKCAEDILSIIGFIAPQVRIVHVRLDPAPNPSDLHTSPSKLGMYLTLLTYQNNTYKTIFEPVRPETIVISPWDSKDGRLLLVVAEAANSVRDLVIAPANFKRPPTLSNIMRQHASRAGNGFNDNISDRKLGEAIARMHGLQAVASGSSVEPRLVQIDHHHPDAKATIVLLGKGVTFDSGGISLKPPRSMHQMKADMAGAAVVCGVLCVCRQLNFPLNVIGLVGLIENMPSGSAARPGDVVRMYDNQTVEILDTDAEGRMVLGDLLAYAQEKWPDADFVIDIATLTGAVEVALGDLAAGLFTSNNDLADKLIEAGKQTKEMVWRLPLETKARLKMASTVADLRNIPPGHGADATYAASFLDQFVLPANKAKWAHIDMAAMALDSNDVPTGYGVYLLVQFLCNHAKTCQLK